MTRIPLPDEKEFTPEIWAAMDLMPSRLNLVDMMAHSPELVYPAVHLGMTILKRLRLTPARREILVLLVGAYVKCSYSQTQHIPMARAAGLSDAQITAITEEPRDPSAFADPERVLLEAGEELLRTTNLSAGTVTGLLEHYSYQEIVEMFFVVGHFRTLTGMLNGLDIDIDPAGDKFAAVSSTPAYPLSHRQTADGG
ncbi:carboxymuconolactone decarboxylase family protein [Streptomyces sp. NPDC002520]